jgi:hypothetical protein
LDDYRRRYVAQATGFGNESASDRSEDEPHRRCHSIAKEQAEGEGEISFGEALMSDPLAGSDPIHSGEPSLSSGFDNYRSLANPNIRIIVANDVVPPFRFKAGGWELLSSTTEPGSAIKARIAQKGFFLFRVNEDGIGGSELADFPLPSQGGSVE